MSARRRLWLTIFLGVMTAIAPLSTDMYLPALPEVQQDFSVSTSLVQMTLTMTTLGMALGQILVGPLSDLFGRRRPLFIGMLVFIGAFSFVFSRALPVRAGLLLRVQLLEMCVWARSSRDFFPFS